MSLKPKPQSWDDVKPGDVITWSDTKWSRKLGRPTERPRRLLVRVVEQRRDTSAETVRVVQGVMVTKTDQPNKVMNNYPLTDANHVSTGEMGWCGPLAVDWITSLDRPSYVEEPERYEVVKLDRDGKWHVFDTKTSAEITLDGLDTAWAARRVVDELRQSKGATPVAKSNAQPVKLTNAQWSAINRVSDLGCRGYFSSYAIPTNTSAALVGKGLITHIIRIGGFGRQWLTTAGFKAAGIDLATLVEKAHAEALVENGPRICDEMDAGDAQIHAYAHDVEVTGPKFPKGTPEYEAYATELHAELEKFAKGEAPYEYGPIDKAAVLAKPIDSLMNSGAVEYTKRDDALLQMDLALGRADRKALPIVPAVLKGQCGKDEPHEAHQWPNIVKGGVYACEGVKPAPRTLLELINAHANATGERPKLRAEIERRLNLAVGLMPTEVRQILDGRA
jgi:hypothetical protein